MIMKAQFLYSFIVALILLTGCDDNTIMPTFESLGTATHTMADISVSNTAPLPSENVSVLISYVNPSSDPLKEIVVKAKVGAGDYTEIQKFSMTSETPDQLQTKTFSFAAPATAATTVVFDMVITSQREFPQTQRANFKTK